MRDGLALIEQFVNTRDLDEGSDAPATSDTLGAWLVGHGLARASSAWTAADHGRVVVLRECLRELMLANTTGTPDPGAAATASALGRDAPLAVAVDATGRTRLRPLGHGVASVLGRLLAIVAEAQAADEWPRMKACLAEDCRWAFYDGSRNRSRTWCSMRVCGNRAKARSYRSRQG